MSQNEVIFIPTDKTTDESEEDDKSHKFESLKLSKTLHRKNGVRVKMAFLQNAGEFYAVKSIDLFRYKGQEIII